MLKTKPIALWTDQDREGVIEACKIENMSPRLPILFTPENIESLLKKSYCRGCGACCGHGPKAVPPDSRSLFLFESELRRVGQHGGLKWAQLTKNATRHESKANGWYLPFPCIFHTEQSCRVYESRPFNCRTFPLLNYLLDGKYYIAVNVQCEYGSDIYRHALEEFTTGQDRPG